MRGLCECGCGEATKIAWRSDAGIGWVKGEPLRYIRGHQATHAAGERWQEKTLRYREEDRGHVTACWIWQLRCDAAGYGQVRHEGTLWSAHRFYWVQANGPVPEELELDHLCRVRACCNPAHLEAVTRSVNQARAHPYRRTPLRGPTVLPDDDVRAIRTAPGLHREIAEAYGVTRSWVSHIKSGRARKSVV